MIDKLLFGSNLGVVREATIASPPTQDSIESSFLKYKAGVPRARIVLALISVIFLISLSSGVSGIIASQVLLWAVRIFLLVFIVFLCINTFSTESDYSAISEQQSHFLNEAAKELPRVKTYLDKVHNLERSLYRFEYENLAEHIKLQRHYKKSGLATE